jgi:hypothetical protein
MTVTRAPTLLTENPASEQPQHGGRRRSRFNPTPPFATGLTEAGAGLRTVRSGPRARGAAAGKDTCPVCAGPLPSCSLRPCPAHPGRPRRRAAAAGAGRCGSRRCRAVQAGGSGACERAGRIGPWSPDFAELTPLNLMDMAAATREQWADAMARAIRDRRGVHDRRGVRSDGALWRVRGFGVLGAVAGRGARGGLGLLAGGS